MYLTSRLCSWFFYWLSYSFLRSPIHWNTKSGALWTALLKTIEFLLTNNQVNKLVPYTNLFSSTDAQKGSNDIEFFKKSIQLLSELDFVTSDDDYRCIWFLNPYDHTMWNGFFYLSVAYLGQLPTFISHIEG